MLADTDRDDARRRRKIQSSIKLDPPGKPSVRPSATPHWFPGRNGANQLAARRPTHPSGVGAVAPALALTTRQDEADHLAPRRKGRRLGLRDAAVSASPRARARSSRERAVEARRRLSRPRAERRRRAAGACWSLRFHVRGMRGARTAAADPSATPRTPPCAAGPLIRTVRRAADAAPGARCVGRLSRCTVHTGCVTRRHETRLRFPGTHGRTGVCHL